MGRREILSSGGELGTSGWVSGTEWRREPESQPSVKVSDDVGGLRFQKVDGVWKTPPSVPEHSGLS